jgi:DNA-binding transcriptional ArsR family regulator
VTTTNTLRAIAHPLRLQILSLLTGTQLSAAEVGRELDTTQANASYHLRVLAAAGLIVPAGEKKIRGGVAKRYRHPWRSEDRPDRGVRFPTAQLDHQTLIQALAQQLVRRSTQRRDGRSHFVDAELWVEPDTWRQCVDLVNESSTLIHDAARPPRTEGTIRVTMSAALFMLADPGSTS